MPMGRRPRTAITGWGLGRPVVKRSETAIIEAGATKETTPNKKNQRERWRTAITRPGLG